MGYSAEEKRIWRFRTGRTKKMIGGRLPPAKIGTRSCYKNCVKRPEGPHPECKAANAEYQRYYMQDLRAGIHREREDF